jgi:LPS export ABC transporter protein LptC
MEKFGPKTRKGWRKFLGWKWLAGLVLLVALGYWGLSYLQRPAPPPPSPKLLAEAPSRMEILSITEVQDGDKRWVLEGQKANFHKERDEIGISGVKIEFFGAPGQHFLVQGDEGLLNTKTRVLTLQGNVEMKSGDLSLKTSAIIYHPTERVLVAPEEVVMEGPKVRVQGKGLRVELTQKKMVLAQHRLTQVKTEGWELPR